MTSSRAPRLSGLARKNLRLLQFSVAVESPGSSCKKKPRIPTRKIGNVPLVHLYFS
jgi:hypothetical protein